MWPHQVAEVVDAAGVLVSCANESIGSACVPPTIHFSLEGEGEIAAVCREIAEIARRWSRLQWLPLRDVARDCSEIAPRLPRCGGSGEPINPTGLTLVLVVCRGASWSPHDRLMIAS